MKEKSKLAQRLIDLRKDKGLTQTQAASEIGIDYAAIRNYENSLREPNSKAMATLEKYYGVSGAYLRGETDERGDTSVAAANMHIPKPSRKDNEICYTLDGTTWKCGELEQIMIYQLALLGEKSKQADDYLLLEYTEKMRQLYEAIKGNKITIKETKTAETA